MTAADDSVVEARSLGHAKRRARIVERALQRPVLTVFVLALASRVVVALLLSVKFGGMLFLDDVRYVEIAGDVAAGDTGRWDEYTQFVFDRTATFLLPMAGLFVVFGTHAIVGQLLVAVFGAVTAALVTRLGLEVLPRGTALLAGLVVALYPSQVFFSSLTLKDAFVWSALSATALLAALAGRLHGRPLAAVGGGLLVVLILLGFLRQHTLVVACVALVMSALAGHRRDRLLRLTGAVVLLCLVPLVVGAGLGGYGVVSGAIPPEVQRSLGAAGASTAVVEAASSNAAVEQARRRAEAAKARVARLRASLSRPDRSPSDVARVRAAITRATAAAAAAKAEVKRLAASAVQDQDRGAGATAGSLWRNLTYLPQGLSVMLFEPYPWQGIDNKRLLLAQIENFLWYPLLTLAAYGALRIRDRARALLFPALVAMGTATMWALVEGNLGTAYRHRGEFVWAVVLLAAGGLVSLRRRSAVPLATTGLNALPR